MSTYLINSILGFFLIEENTPTKALAKWATNGSALNNSFLDREELLERGYRFVIPTKHKEVFLIK